MLATPDSAHASYVRQSFTELVDADWRDILIAAKKRNWADAVTTDLLAAALAARSPGGARSEYYYAYFSCVDAIKKSDVPAIRRGIRALGNVLLEDFANGELQVEALPVLTSGATLVVPAGDALSRRLPAPAHGLADLSYLRAQGEQILATIERSWIRRTDGTPLRGNSLAVEAELEKYADQTLAISHQDPRLAVTHSAQGAESVYTSKYVRALELIDEIDEDQAGEVRAVTEYVVPLKGAHFVGGSDITLFGASFLRLDKRWSELCFADHIIHEGTHQLLHAHQEVEPLLLNREASGIPSPIRKDPRPLYGSFHATFVFLRLSQFMAAVMGSPREDLHGEARLRLHRHLLGLLQGLKILDENGVYTKRGREELDAWIGQARELVAFDGIPDPRLYNQVTWDYDDASSALPFHAL